MGVASIGVGECVHGACPETAAACVGQGRKEHDPFYHLSLLAECVAKLEDPIGQWGQEDKGCAMASPFTLPLAACVRRCRQHSSSSRGHKTGMTHPTPPHTRQEYPSKAVKCSTSRRVKISLRPEAAQATDWWPVAEKCSGSSRASKQGMPRGCTIVATSKQASKLWDREGRTGRLATSCIYKKIRY